MVSSLSMSAKSELRFSASSVQPETLCFPTSNSPTSNKSTESVHIGLSAKVVQCALSAKQHVPLQGTVHCSPEVWLR